MYRLAAITVLAVGACVKRPPQLSPLDCPASLTPLPVGEFLKQPSAYPAPVILRGKLRQIAEQCAPLDVVCPPGGCCFPCSAELALAEDEAFQGVHLVGRFGWATYSPCEGDNCELHCALPVEDEDVSIHFIAPPPDALNDGNWREFLEGKNPEKGYQSHGLWMHGLCR
jgi:hypothetical protein